ncbi:cyclin-domain-containing protein [Hesseltinella vesiculosa]|uniref:Cyclin-domain-containing protein n=1 Tax=Hesseltinella vesiculosa TaxID=101127 RepID=A0A1X2GFF1_9FUNG|nr:cyclin-domain-containing protein [Hesseltinella vesiculosa]
MISPSFDLALHPTHDTITLLASLLERMTTANDQLNKPTQRHSHTTHPQHHPPSKAIRKSSSASPVVPQPTYTLFHARSIPSIDIYSYLSRILKYCPCTNECFLSLLVYFDRMSKNALALTGQPFTIDSYNIHRLIISGVMVSSKFFSDIFYTNTRYAKVGGLPVTELNRLELEFLQLNDFNISVSISELQRYGDQLLKVGMMEKEMRLLCDRPVPLRHGRSTSLGSPVRANWLDDQHQDTDPHRQNLDQQLADTAQAKLHMEDPRRYSNGPPMPGPATINTNGSSSMMYAYASPPQPNGGGMRRMGSIGSMGSHPSGFQPSPTSFTTYSSTYSTSTIMTTPPLLVRPTSVYQNTQRHSFVDPSTSSPPKIRQRHGSMGWHEMSLAYYPGQLPAHGRVSPHGIHPGAPQHHASPLGRSSSASSAANATAPAGPPLSTTMDPTWRAPRQCRSSANLYQQASTTFVPVDPYQMNNGMGPGVGNGRRLSVSSAHAASTFIPQHRVSDPLGKNVYYSSYSVGIPTPPPSLSPIHQDPTCYPTSATSQQLYL